MHQLCNVFVSKERHFFVQFCLLISFGWRPAVSKRLDRIEQILIEMFSCHASQMAFIARKHTKNVISYTISSNYNSLGCRFYLVRKLILWLPFYVTIHENKYALPGIILPLFIAVFTAMAGILCRNTVHMNKLYYSILIKFPLHEWNEKLNKKHGSNNIRLAIMNKKDFAMR